MSSIPYRPDIDGLRAIAVIAVILFHADVPFIKGGYLGVDIFFVISGFLIGSILLKEIEDASFRFATFFEKRVRRIFPAGLVVVVTTLIFCKILYFYTDIHEVAHQAFSQLVMSSNIYFYLSADYFNADVLDKPFLHFWSLSLEEQFYIALPLLLLGLRSFKPIERLIALILLAGLSCVLYVIFLQKDHSAAFYLLLFRGWEFLWGVIVAEYIKNFTIHKIFLHSAGGILGILLIGLGIFNIVPLNETIFPAFFVCFGTLMVILYGSSSHGFVKYLLSLRILTFLGLISYSLYLWHWPILTISRYITPLGLSVQQTLICLFVTFLLAAMSWKFVEQPFRRSNLSISYIIILYFAAFVIASWVLFTTKNADQYLEASMKLEKVDVSEAPHAKICDLKNVSFKEQDLCQTNRESNLKPSFIVWGDSYARSASTTFYNLSKKYNQNGYLAYLGDCPPILNLERVGNSDGGGCAVFNKHVVDFIKSKKIKHVFLIANWTYWHSNADDFFVNSTKEQLAFKVKNIIDEIWEPDVSIYFVLNHANAKFFVPRLWAMEQKMDVVKTKTIIPRELYLEERRQNADRLLSILNKDKIKVVDPINLFCNKTGCLTVKDNIPLYYDTGHLSKEGAVFIEPMFESLFDEGFN